MVFKKSKIQSSLLLTLVLSLFIVGTIVFGSLMFFHIQNTTAQGVEYRLFGWLYSNTYGWISLNSDNLNPSNCVSPQCNDTGIPYSVKLSSDNAISGYGWSSNVGWVCFGANCQGTTPVGASPSASLDINSGKINGWAQVAALGGDGWVHFRGNSVGSAVGSACYDCKKSCSQWTQQCNEGECIPVEPCLQYDTEKFDSCGTCFSSTYFDGTNIPNPAVESVAGGSGYTCSACTNCAIVRSAGGAERTECQTCPPCELYGVNSSLSDGGLYGWSWNGFKADSNTQFGAGWTHFFVNGSGITYPWLETKYGALYSQGIIRQKAGLGSATYCIFAKDIERVKSANCANEVIKDVDINFLELSEETYKNAIGKIDIDGLVTSVQLNGIINKYRQEIVSLTQSNWQSKLSAPLNGKVYVTSGDLKIDDELIIPNASSAGVAGNGTIVVNGDLIVGADIDYSAVAQGDPAFISGDLNRLASVGWIVRGDVVIDPAVKNIVGAFIILGRDGQVCKYENDVSCDATTNYPKYKQNSYGTFFSGASGDPLTVWGLVVARAFDFRRTFADLAKGSERIIYDGRLTANPPPGLSSFTEGLPVIRDFSY